MLNTNLKDCAYGELNDLFRELEQITGRLVDEHQNVSVLQFLELCQRNEISKKRQRLDASNLYKGCILRTSINRLNDGEVLKLTKCLCAHFSVHHGLVVNRVTYMFFNDILNPKSKLRKPPPVDLLKRSDENW